MRAMSSQKMFLSFAHAGVLAVLALSSALLAGCASSESATRSLSEFPDTYATVFLAPVEVRYEGAASLNASVLAQNAGISFANSLSEKGYTVLVTDSGVSEVLIEEARGRLRLDANANAVLLEKLQREQRRKHYAVLKNGELADVLWDTGEFRNGLKADSYVTAIGNVQIIEPPALPAQYEQSRQFGKSLVFNVDLETLDATGRSVKWTSRSGHGEVRSSATADALTNGQINEFAHQVLKELPEIQSAQGPAQPKAK
jgi:hypothetical protein